MKWLSPTITALMIIMLIAEMRLFWTNWRNVEKTAATDVELRKLTRLALTNFPGAHGLSESAFWESLGHKGNPILDPWSNPYRLENLRAPGSAESMPIWRSAGPDGHYNTRDDIVMPIVFVSPVQEHSPDMPPREVHYHESAK